jgi:hypothetical protein
MRYGIYPYAAPFVLASRDRGTKYGVRLDFTWFADGGDVDNAMVAGRSTATAQVSEGWSPCRPLSPVKSRNSWCWLMAITRPC